MIIFWSALPDLEPKSTRRAIHPTEGDITQCLEDIRKGKTATTKQLLSMLAGVGGREALSPHPAFRWEP